MEPNKQPFYLYGRNRITWADMEGAPAVDLISPAMIDWSSKTEAKAFTNVLTVGLGKDYQFNFVQAAIDFANIYASATNPYLIKIASGIYVGNLTFYSNISLSGDGTVIIRNSGVNHTVSFNGITGVYLYNIEFQLTGSLTSSKSLFEQTAEGTNNITAINCIFSVDIANVKVRYSFNLTSTTTLRLINPVFNVTTTGGSNVQICTCIYVPSGKAVNLILINPEWNLATGAYAYAMDINGTGTNHIFNPIMEHRHTNQAIFLRGGTTYISGGYLHSTSGRLLNLYNNVATCAVHLLGTNIKNDSGSAIFFLLYAAYAMSLYGSAVNIEGSTYGVEFGIGGTLSGGEIVLSGTVRGATADIYRRPQDSAITIKDAGVHLYNGTSTNITWTRTLGADTVDDIHASATATANYLLSLNASKDLPMDGQVTGLTVPDANGEAIRQRNEITETILTDQYNYNQDFANRTGFPGAGLTTTLLTFVGSTTRTLTISSVGATFDYYIKGVKYTVTTSDAIQLTTDTEKKWYIWYDGATLTTSQTQPANFFKGGVAPVAIVYWDATNKVGIHIHRETHNISTQTHNELHYTVGATYRTGFDISGYTLDTATDAAVTFGLTGGITYDEDMPISVVDDATPDADFEQDLSDPAKLPVHYLDGAGADIRTDTATDYAFKNTASGRINWNELTGGAWQQTECTDNYFVPYLICGANLVSEPVFSVQGQAEYSKLADAIEAGLNAFDLSQYAIEELKPLYLCIFRSKSTLGGTRKAKLVYVGDFRSVTAGAGQTLTSVAHNALSDRNVVACHPASAIAPNITNFDGALSATDIDLQTALETLDDIIVRITGDQSIAGIKTFTDPLLVANTVAVADVSNYNVKLDNTLNVAISAANANQYGLYNHIIDSTTFVAGAINRDVAGFCNEIERTEANSQPPLRFVGIDNIIKLGAGASAPIAAYGIRLNTAFLVAPSAISFGLDIQNHGVAGCPLTYGLFIDTQSGSTVNHGIYQAGTANTNILAGKTRMGDTATPTETLEVAGNVLITGTDPTQTMTDEDGNSAVDKRVSTGAVYNKTNKVYTPGGLAYALGHAAAANNTVVTPNLTISNSNGAVTFAGWFNITGQSASYQAFALVGQYGTTTGFFLLWIPPNTDNVLLWYSNGASISNATWTGALTGKYGTKRQIVFTFDTTNAEAELYIDDTSKGVKALTTPVFPASGQPARFGSYNATLHRMVGIFDEIALWDEEKGSAWVTSDYNSGVGTHRLSEASMVCGYHCNEGTAVTLDDISDNNYDATIGSAVTWETGFIPIPGADATTEFINSRDGIEALIRGIHDWGHSSGQSGILGSVYKLGESTPVADYPLTWDGSKWVGDAQLDLTAGVTGVLPVSNTEAKVREFLTATDVLDDSSDTTTSVTFVDVDNGGAPLAVSIANVPAGATVLLTLTAGAFNNADPNNTYFDIYDSVESAYVSGGLADGLVRFNQSGNSYHTVVAIAIPHTCTTGGSYTWTLKWRVSAGTATINGTASQRAVLGAIVLKK